MFAVLREAVIEAVFLKYRSRLRKLLSLAEVALPVEEYWELLAIASESEEHWRRARKARWN